MSARRTTVGQLRAALEQYPDDMMCVSIHPGQEDWHTEGTVDGVRVSPTYGWEVRTGWHILHPSEVPLDDPWSGAEKLLLIHDFTPDNLLEWQDDQLDGPSPFAECNRQETP